MVLELVLEPELELGVELVPVLELGSVLELVLASEPGFELESALELVLELELVPEALEAVPEAVRGKVRRRLPPTVRRWSITRDSFWE